MAEEGLQVVGLQDTFYRDNFGKVILLIVSFLAASILLSAVSLYLHLSKPKPVSFSVYSEWRVVGPVPVDQPYLTIPDLLQWTSDAIRSSFIFDFNNYNEQLKKNMHYFTSDGWTVYLNQLNNYASYNQLLTNKTFVSSSPNGAPIVLNQGILSGRYGWWVQVPLDISYVGPKNTYDQSLTLQVLVVRVPTTDNLNGVGIDNIIVVNGVNNTSGGA